MFVSIEVITSYVSIYRINQITTSSENNIPEGTDDSPNRPPSLQERKPPYKQKTRLSPNWELPDKNRVSSTLLTVYSMLLLY